MRIHIPKGVSFSPFGIQAAVLCDPVGDDAQIDPHKSGIILHPFRVGIAFVAGFMGDDQRTIRLIEPADQFDGGFNAFSGYQPGRLKNKEAVVRQSDLSFEVPVVIVDLLREDLKIHDIRNQGSTGAGAPGKFRPGDGVDDHMLDVGLGRRK